MRPPDPAQGSRACGCGGKAVGDVESPIEGFGGLEGVAAAHLDALSSMHRSVFTRFSAVPLAFSAAEMGDLARAATSVRGVPSAMPVYEPHPAGMGPHHTDLLTGRNRRHGPRCRCHSSRRVTKAGSSCPTVRSPVSATAEQRAKYPAAIGIILSPSPPLTSGAQRAPHSRAAVSPKEPAMDTARAPLTLSPGPERYLE
jgi:hypothetical protein